MIPVFTLLLFRIRGINVFLNARSVMLLFPKELSLPTTSLASIRWILRPTKKIMGTLQFLVSRFDYISTFFHQQKSFF